VTFLASAFTAGQTLTASLMESIRDSANAGHNIYTNEAARDAAITAPVEGMMVYLTAPTVPAAAGATTFLPSGVQTIWNGFVWVCVTPVGSLSNTSGASTNTAYHTTLTGDGTAISVTLVTGTTARIDMNAVGAHSTTSKRIFLSYAVSGATTVAAADANAIDVNEAVGTYQMSLSRSNIITGLTAGTNTFTLNYKGQVGTATWISRNLIVTGIA